jgi:hypothetical protein
LLTFGAPRVGNAEFSNYIDKTLKYRHRVVNEADLVPHIPPCLSIGGNVCSKFFGLGYFHSQNEIWYPNGSELGSKYVTTTRNEDPRGSNGLSKYEMKYHIQYFGMGDPSIYAANKCIE